MQLCPEDGSSRFYRNVDSCQTVWRHIAPPRDACAADVTHSLDLAGIIKQGAYLKRRANKLKCFVCVITNRFLKAVLCVLMCLCACVGACRLSKATHRRYYLLSSVLYIPSQHEDTKLWKAVAIKAERKNVNRPLPLMPRPLPV
jgi:hypothetical protein